MLPDSMDDLFSRNSTWQAWLDVEAALARAQAKIGMIPREAADEIVSKCALEQIDVDALAQDMNQSMSPVMSLVRAVAQRCKGDAGGYVHWGATTQNIIVTGKMLQLRRAHHGLLARSGRALTQMAELAEVGADWPTAARTNRRHALPITFGYRVAGWIDEIERDVERLEAAVPRVFLLTFGGAAGAMHSWGENGPALVRALGAELDMAVSRVHSRAALDGLGEYVGVLALFATACERIGGQLYELMADEIEEVAEQQGDTVIGSSTMPHKTNPKYVVTLLTEACRLRQLAGPALEACRPSFDGDAATNFRLYDILDDAGAVAYRVAVALEALFVRLRPDAKRMAANLARSAEGLASEHVMMQLARRIGRQRAHELLHTAMHRRESEQATLVEILFEEVDVRSAYDNRDALAHDLDPERYIGRSREVALDLAESGRATADALSAHEAAFNPSKG